MATRFAHLCCYVRDLACSRAFYTDFFGLQFEKQVVGDDGQPFVVFLTLGDGTFLELWQHEDAGAMHGHLAFWVDDIATFAQGLHARGVVVSAPDLRPSGNTIAFLQDPDGNTIELLCAPPGERHSGIHASEPHYEPARFARAAPKEQE